MRFGGFIGGAYEGRSKSSNPQDCVNLYPVIDRTGAKSEVMLVGAPGLKEFASLSGEVRGIFSYNNQLYAIFGDKFCAVDALGTVTEKGTLETTIGVVEAEYNGNQVMVVDGSFGYIYDVSADTFNKITDLDFPVPSSLAYQDGYFIVSENGTDSFYVSSLYDGTNWDALDFASAESQPDAAVAIASDHRELWIFGERTVEVYYNSGNAAFPFDRISGSLQEIGCGAKHSVVKADNTLFWFDNRGFVVRATGYNHKIVSTRNIEYQWQQYSRTDDAVAFTYTVGGHIMYHITFPTEGKTWVYDVAMDAWHQRASFVNAGSVIQGRHRANCAVWAHNKYLVGDYANGTIYELDLDTYTDDGEPIVRERVCQIISNENKRLVFRKFEIDLESGVGSLTYDPQIMLAWSDDSGYTWSNEIWRTAGKTGEYFKRAVWYNIGMGRNRVFKVRITDATKVVLIGAYIDLQAGRH